MSKISAKQMDAFVAVMSHGSITAAAQHMNVSQPAISRMLERFEQEAGFVAFERRKGKLNPTPEAGMFFNEVTRVYRGLNYLNEIAKEIGETRRGYLRIGVFPAFSEGWISQRVGRYLVGRKHLQTSVIPMASDNIADAVSRQSIDIGISLRHTTREGLLCEEIAGGDLVCILPKGHRLKDKEIIKPEDVYGEDFINMVSADIDYKLFDETFAMRGISRRICAESTWASTICHMVAQNIGMAIMLRDTAEEYAHLGYHLVPFEHHTRYRVYLVSSSERPLSEVAKGFRQILFDDFAQANNLLQAKNR